MSKKRLIEIMSPIPEDLPPLDETQAAIQAAEYGSDVPAWDAHENVGQNLPMPEIMKQIEQFIDSQHAAGRRNAIQVIKIITGHGTIYAAALEHIKAMQGQTRIKGVKPVDYILDCRGHELGDGMTNAVIYAALAPNTK